MKPILFNADEKEFLTYGLGEIDAIEATVTRERNGNYLLYIEYPSTGPLASVFQNEMKIKCDAGVRTKNQTFEIGRINKNSKNIIKIYAKHISHKLEHMSLKPGTSVGNASADVALNVWKNNLVGDVSFDVWTDVDTVPQNINWAVNKIENARKALGGSTGSILDAFGGEFEFDNNLIRLHKQLGRKIPTVLEYGRNIISAESDEDIDTTYTSIYPYAIYTPKSENSTQILDPVIVTLPEVIIDSEYLTNFISRRIKQVDLSSKFKHGEVPTEAKLRSYAISYMKDNRFGLPKVDTKIDYIDLSTTLDYWQKRILEEVELCDIVPVYYPQIGLTIEDDKITSIKYDALLERNSSVEIKTIGSGFRQAVTGNIDGRLTIVEQENQKIINSVPYLINGLGNRIWYVTPDPNVEHKVGDTWFEKNGIYTRINVWDGEDWINELDSEDIAKIRSAIETVESQATTLQEELNKAKQDLINIELTPGDSAYQIAVKHGFQGTEEEWLKSLEPAPPIPGPAGDDGKTLYTWVKYADNDKGLNMSDYPTETTQYIGLAVGKETPIKSNVYTDYQWTKVKGDQGLDGRDGSGFEWNLLKDTDVKTKNASNPSTYNEFYLEMITPGFEKNSWFYIPSEFRVPNETQTLTFEYKVLSGDPPMGGHLYSTTNDKIYLNGELCGDNWSRSNIRAPLEKWNTISIQFTNDSLEIPTDNNIYVQPERATQYKTPYKVAIRNISLRNGAHISPSWTPHKDEINGTDGQTLYTWIKYADTETGQGISDDPTGKKYIGLAYNKTTATESVNPADYTWSAMYDMDALNKITLKLDELSQQAEMMVSVTGNDKEMIYSDNRLDDTINGDDWSLSLEEGTKNLTHNGSGYDVTQTYHFRTLVKYVPRIPSTVKIEFEVI